jgi:hypothetical protein
MKLEIYRRVGDVLVTVCIRAIMDFGHVRFIRLDVLYAKCQMIYLKERLQVQLLLIVNYMQTTRTLEPVISSKVYPVERTATY